MATAAHRANKKRNVHMGSRAIDIFLNGLTQGCGSSHERKKTLYSFTTERLWRCNQRTRFVTVTTLFTFSKVMVPERSPVPLFKIETATLEVESIPVAMNGMLDEPTVRIG